MLVLIAAASIPTVLNWQQELRPLNPLMRRLFWVYAAFIAGTIGFFAVLSWICAPMLASGSVLARVVSGFIALFWTARLVVQMWVFDAKPLLDTVTRRWGYHCLTGMFSLLVPIYAWLALH